MRTEKQKAASRANGARSRGPITPEGKALAVRKPIPRGSLARAVVREGESRKHFNEFLDRLNYVLKPETDLDHLLIGKMAAAHWRLLRVWQVEQAGEDVDTRLTNSLDRQFYRTYDRYLRLHPQTPQQNFSNPLDPLSDCKQ